MDIEKYAADTSDEAKRLVRFDAQSEPDSIREMRLCLARILTIAKGMQADKNGNPRTLALVVTKAEETAHWLDWII